MCRSRWPRDDRRRENVKPGDKLHYYVSFDGPLQEHAHVAAGLILQTSLEKGQEQFGQGFTAQQRGKVSETVYELEAIVPGEIGSGMYRLTNISVNYDGGGGKAYQYPADFKNDNTFRVVNDVHHQYPNIKSVTPEPPK